MGHGRSAITGAVYRRRFGRACKCRLNVRPATINAATAGGAVRPNTRKATSGKQLGSDLRFFDARNPLQYQLLVASQLGAGNDW